MKVLLIILLVGIVGALATGFLAFKAKDAFAKERQSEMLEKANVERIKETSNWLQAYVGYYELEEYNVSLFLDAILVTEDNGQIEKVYAALTEVGAGALVPPLRRLADAHLEIIARTEHLDSFRDEEEYKRIDAEYIEVYAEAEKEIKQSGLKVYDLLEAYEAEHPDIFGETQK